jgi:hypothetical protein
VTDRKRRERQLSVMDNLLRHNLRNDLDAILGNADLIEDRAPEVADRTAVIRRTGEDLLASADKQRKIIDVQTGKTCQTRLDMTEAVRDAADTVGGRFPAARIELSSSGAAPVCGLSELRGRSRSFWRTRSPTAIRRPPR